METLGKVSLLLGQVGFVKPKVSGEDALIKRGVSGFSPKSSSSPSLAAEDEEGGNKLISCRGSSNDDTGGDDSQLGGHQKSTFSR